MSEAVHVAGSEDETAAKLKRILAGASLAESGGSRFAAALHVEAAKNVPQRATLQTGGLIGVALFVNQQGKSDAGIFAEEAGVGAVAQPNRDNLRALCFELCLMFAQLRDVFAAEDSPIVAQKNDDGGIGLPQRAQADLLAVTIRQHNPGQPRAEGFAHYPLLTLTPDASCRHNVETGPAHYAAWAQPELFLVGLPDRQCGAAGVLAPGAELLFDAQQLVVLGDAVGAAG